MTEVTVVYRFEYDQMKDIVKAFAGAMSALDLRLDIRGGVLIHQPSTIHFKRTYSHSAPS